MASIGPNPANQISQQRNVTPAAAQPLPAVGSMPRTNGEGSRTVTVGKTNPSVLSRFADNISSGFKRLTAYVATIEMPRMPRLGGAAAPRPQPDLAHLAMKGRLPDAGGATTMREIVALQGKIDQVGDRSRALMALREGATGLLNHAMQTRNGLPGVNQQQLLQTQAQMAAIKADKGDAEAAMRTALRALPQAQLTQVLIGLGGAGHELGKELKFALEEQQTRNAAPSREGTQALQEFADAALANRHAQTVAAPNASSRTAQPAQQAPLIALTLVQIGALPDGHPVKAFAVGFLASEFSLENYNFANAAQHLTTLPPGAERSALLEQVLTDFTLRSSDAEPVVNLKADDLKSIHHSLAGRGGPEGKSLRSDINTDTLSLANNAKAQSALAAVTTMRTQLLALEAVHGSAGFAQAIADTAQINDIKGQIAVIQLLEPGSRDAELSKLEGQLQISQLKQQLTAALPAVSSQTGVVTLAEALSPAFASTLEQAQADLQQKAANLEGHLLSLQATLDTLPSRKSAFQREDEVITALTAGAENLQNLFATDTLSRLNTAFSAVASPHIDHSAGTKVARHHAALARMPELTRGALDAFQQQPDAAPGATIGNSPIRSNSPPPNGGWEAAVSQALDQGINTLPMDQAVNIPRTIWGGQRVLPENLLAGLARHSSIPAAIGDLTYKNTLGRRDVADNTPEQRTAAALQLREFIQTALNPEQRAALQERIDFLAQLPPLLLKKSGVPNDKQAWTSDEAIRAYTKSVAVSGAGYLGVSTSAAADMLGLTEGSNGGSAAKDANQMLSDVVIALMLHGDVVFAPAEQ